jgi:hypothetical protein
MKEKNEKRALVIGSLLPPLRGTDNDALAMSTLLEGRGFEVEMLTGAAATRKGILAAYDRLIEEVAKDGAAVLYYAGHGGYAVHAGAAPDERAEIQCIFPTDWTAAAEKDASKFCAILDVELSVRLRRLTDKTPNATIILDCCHASEMVRGPGADPELIPRVYGSGWARLAPAFLAEHPVDITQLAVEGNPHAVRIVATAPDRQAYEVPVRVGDDVVYRGLFTTTLERVLAECDRAPLSWRTIASRVRELVLERAEQAPRVEGPADRLPFTTEVLKRPDAVVFAYDGGKPCLRANRILGANVGAKYSIMSPTKVQYDPDHVVAYATVVELVGPNAHVTLQLTAADRPPQAGALAFPNTLPYPPLPVAIEGAGAKRLAEQIRTPHQDGRPRRLDVVEDARQARFSVVADGTSLSTSTGGLPARIALDDDDRGRGLLIDWLERWSKAEALRELTTEGVPHTALEVRWGRVEPHRTADGGLGHSRMVPHGPKGTMHLGEWVYVTVTNHWDAPLYVAIFDIGIAGKVTLLTMRSPYGRKLALDQSFTLGQRDSNAPVVGVGPTSWPEEVPKTVPGPDGVPRPLPRRESLVVIAATAETNFERLANEALPTRGNPRGGNRLEVILDSFRTGLTRDFAPEPTIEGFFVHRIDFDLSPEPRP